MATTMRVQLLLLQAHCYYAAWQSRMRPAPRASMQLMASAYHENLERVAVVIDCESAKSWPGQPVDLLMLELAQWGSALVRRAYGDLSDETWQQSLVNHAFTPVHDLNGGKAARTALVIDCMDMLFDRDIDTFVMVANSGALSRLATRIRESNRKVVGYGDREADRDLVVACHRFVYLDNLGLDIADLCDVEELPIKMNAKGVVRNQRVDKCLSGAKLRQNQLLMEMLAKAVRDNAADDDWALLATVGREILRFLPDFDPRDFGYTKLGDLLRATDLFDLEARDPDKRTLQVRIRPPHDALPPPSADSSSDTVVTELYTQPRRALV